MKTFKNIFPEKKQRKKRFEESLIALEKSGQIEKDNKIC